MKVKFLVLSTLVTGLLLSNCTDSDDDKTAENLLLLAALNNSGGSSIAAQFPNQIVGSTESVKSSTAVSSGVSSATSSATSTTQQTVVRIAGEESLLAGSKSLGSTKATTTCDGTNRTTETNYTQERTVTASTSTASYLTSGSYTVKPNIKTVITGRCTGQLYTNGTQENTIKQTGSLEITFINAKIRYMDIEAFVKNGVFEFKETTLNGTVTTSDFNYSYILNQNISTSTTDKTRNSQLTASGPSSSKASSSNLQVDGGNPVAMNITNESNLVASLDMKSNTETNTSCYQSLNYQAGGKNYGTFNGEQVVASYNYTTEDYKKLMEKQGQTVTMCQ